MNSSAGNMRWSGLKARHSPEEDLGVQFFMRFPFLALSSCVAESLGRKPSA